MAIKFLDLCAIITLSGFKSCLITEGIYLGGRSGAKRNEHAAPHTCRPKVGHKFPAKPVRWPTAKLTLSVLKKLLNLPINVIKYAKIPILAILAIFDIADNYGGTVYEIFV